MITPQSSDRIYLKLKNSTILKQAVQSSNGRSDHDESATCKEPKESVSDIHNKPNTLQTRIQRTVVQLLPPGLQAPELLLTLLIRVVRLQVTCEARHGLVHGDHNAERPCCRRKVESERCAEPGQLGGGKRGLVAVQVGGDGEDEVGEGAGAVEWREELLGVVQQICGHGAGVMRRHFAELQHGHDER